jgi:hypothetical protein
MTGVWIAAGFVAFAALLGLIQYFRPTRRTTAQLLKFGVTTVPVPAWTADGKPAGSRQIPSFRASFRLASGDVVELTGDHTTNPPWRSGQYGRLAYKGSTLYSFQPLDQ